jgi:hypothetical protein
MHLDVRIPLGWLFLILGVILAVYGAGTDHDVRHLDLHWGVVFALFGAVVLILAHRKKT